MNNKPKLSDLPGIGPASIEKLEKAGIYEVMSVATMVPSTLSETSGISVSTARKAILAAQEMCDLGFVSGNKFEDDMNTIFGISTGSKEIDNLLGGGVKSRAMTEAHGQFGSSKSQLGFTLAVNVQIPKEKGGVEKECVFIDAEGTFSPSRIREIARERGLDEEKIISGIHVARAFNSDHQMLLVDKITDLIKEGHDIGLVIVDSLTTHFRVDFQGRGQLADRQQKLNRHMHDLINLAYEHNFAVYVTNQVMANPAQLFGDPTTAIGGNIVGHTATYRLYLRRAKQGSRLAKLIDSPDMPDGEAVYYVGKRGIQDEID